MIDLAVPVFCLATKVFDLTTEVFRLTISVLHLAMTVLRLAIAVLRLAVAVFDLAASVKALVVAVFRRPTELERRNVPQAGASSPLRTLHRPLICPVLWRAERVTRRRAACFATVGKRMAGAK